MGCSRDVLRKDQAVRSFLLPQARWYFFALISTTISSAHRIPDAIKAHQRALLAADSDAYKTAQKIGDLHAELGNSNASLAYYRRALAEALREGLPKSEVAELYLWLARWEIQKEREKGKGSGKSKEGEEGDLGLAEQYLKEVLAIPEVKEVRQLFDFLTFCGVGTHRGGVLLRTGREKVVAGGQDAFI